MGHLLGAEKGNFLIRGAEADDATVYIYIYMYIYIYIVYMYTGLGADGF